LRGAGIRKVADLKGHSVGATKGTAPHFFLDLVLNKNRMTEKDIKMQFLKGEELHKALVDEKLDAIVTTDMNAYKIKEALGDKIILITDPGIVLNHGYLATLKPTLAKKRGELKRMLVAMKAAEKLAMENPDEARELFSAYLKVSPKVASQIWESITPKISLDSAMLMTLEDNARWLKEREGGKSLNKSFREVVWPELLLEIAPESVSF
jgi:sulfonate transport system substrate-binding protein